MRARTALATLLLALASTAYLATPAAALSTCGGAYALTAACTFTCGDPKLSVWGDAQNWGAIASVQVQADCGIVTPAGTFVAVYGVGCSSVGSGQATCSNSIATPAIWVGVPLTGVCTVNGQVVGNWMCLAS